MTVRLKFSRLCERWTKRAKFAITVRYNICFELTDWNIISITWPATRWKGTGPLCQIIRICTTYEWLSYKTPEMSGEVLNSTHLLARKAFNTQSTSRLQWFTDRNYLTFNDRTAPAVYPNKSTKCPTLTQSQPCLISASASMHVCPVSAVAPVV